jgi:hypothetical protein
MGTYHGFIYDKKTELLVTEIILTNLVIVIYKWLGLIKILLNTPVLCKVRSEKRKYLVTSLHLGSIQVIFDLDSLNKVPTEFIQVHEQSYTY